jgi:signal transduction histidine kinase
MTAPQPNPAPADPGAPREWTVGMDVSLLRRLSDVMAEFVSALLDRGTYAPLRNPYILFGFLWGLPVPLLWILLRRQHLVSDPLFWFLALHPPIFAVVFGAMGTVRFRKHGRIEGLLRERETEMARMRAAHEELQKLSRLKDEFLGAVTHELKTPLVTIRGYTEMLGNGRLGGTTEDQKQALGAMLRNCQRLQQQIDLLLAASRNQGDQRQIKPVAIPLAELTQEVLERHRPAALQKGVQITCAPPEQPVLLWGDPTRLQEVLDNLLGNAVKFTERGGWVRLAFGAVRGNRIPAEVADSGCGIAPEALQFIFERFRQADGSIRRRFGGSGLGLALARENLLAHGCTIAVESEPGKGARFTFDLPVCMENRAGSGRTAPGRKH